MSDTKWLDDAPDATWLDEAPDAVPAAAPIPPVSVADRAINMIGRGAWALPGLVGLDHERVQSLLGNGTVEEQRALSARVDKDNPVTSGLVRGVSAAPGEALAYMAAPELKLPQAASAVQKFITYGPRMGALAAASEYGSTSHKDPLSRGVGAGAAGVAGGVLGGAMAGALPNPAALVPSRPKIDPAAPEMALARAEGNATAAARVAADAAATAEGGNAVAQGGNAAAQNASTVVVRPPRRILPAALQPPEMIPEAKYLADRGVTITGGLRDPNSPYGHIEIASQSRGIVGPGIRNQRHAALGQAMDLAFEEARPAGVKEKIGPAGNPNDKYTRLKALWDREFDTVRAKDEMIQPAVIQGEQGRPLPAVIDEIVGDASSPESAVWDAASREQASKYLGNQMTRLFGRQKDEAGRVPLGDMMKVLSDVRQARRMAQQREKWDLVDIYSRSEDAIENAITSQASPETSKRLGELFGGYRNFKIVEDAVLKMKDAPGGITPAKLEQAVASTVGRGSEYARGGGGPIRDLSKSVRTVFDESGAPPTGARVLADVGWLTDKLAGPTIYLRNRSAAAAQGGAAAASGGKAAANAKAAALVAARARSQANAASPVPDGISDALMEFVSRPPRTLRPQNSATALPPELLAWLRAKYGLAPGAASAEEDAR